MKVDSPEYYSVNPEWKDVEDVNKPIMKKTTKKNTQESQAAQSPQDIELLQKEIFKLKAKYMLLEDAMDKRVSEMRQSIAGLSNKMNGDQIQKQIKNHSKSGIIDNIKNIISKFKK